MPVSTGISNLSLKQLVLTQLVFFFITINSNCFVSAAQAKFTAKSSNSSCKVDKQEGSIKTKTLTLLNHGLEKS